ADGGRRAASVGRHYVPGQALTAGRKPGVHGSAQRPDCDRRCRTAIVVERLQIETGRADVALTGHQTCGRVVAGRTEKAAGHGDVVAAVTEGVVAGEDRRARVNVPAVVDDEAACGIRRGPVSRARCVVALGRVRAAPLNTAACARRWMAAAGGPVCSADVRSLQRRHASTRVSLASRPLALFADSVVLVIVMPAVVTTPGDALSCAHEPPKVSLPSLAMPAPV